MEQVNQPFGGYATGIKPSKLVSRFLRHHLVSTAVRVVVFIALACVVFRAESTSMSGLPAPAMVLGLVMFGDVPAVALANNEVVGRIVSPVSVEVMNRLSWQQVASKLLLRDDAVFGGISVRVPEIRVGFVWSNIDIDVAFSRDVAKSFVGWVGYVALVIRQPPTATFQRTASNIGLERARNARYLSPTDNTMSGYFHWATCG